MSSSATLPSPASSAASLSATLPSPEAGYQGPTRATSRNSQRRQNSPDKAQASMERSNARWQEPAIREKNNAQQRLRRECKCQEEAAASSEASLSELPSPASSAAITSELPSPASSAASSSATLERRRHDPAIWRMRSSCCAGSADARKRRQHRRRHHRRQRCRRLRPGIRERRHISLRHPRRLAPGGARTHGGGKAGRGKTTGRK